MMAAPPWPGPAPVNRPGPSSRPLFSLFPLCSLLKPEDGQHGRCVAAALAWAWAWGRARKPSGDAHAAHTAHAHTHRARADAWAPVDFCRIGFSPFRSSLFFFCGARARAFAAVEALVLLNFSATCGQDGNAAEAIAEFPFAFVATSGDHAVSHETRLVIRPRTGGIDAARLARLGIAQEEVDNGDTLTEAVQQVSRQAFTFF